MFSCLILDCRGLFLRNTESGKCFKTGELIYDSPNYTLPYFVVMTDNCLDVGAQFRYLSTGTLNNLENNGSLSSDGGTLEYKNRWCVYKGVADRAVEYQYAPDYYLTQTADGALSQDNICAEPQKKYVTRVKCDETNKKFTFGRCIYVFKR